MNEYWFKPKRYGLGARPSTWEGWTLSLGYVLALFGVAAVFGAGDGRHPFAFVAMSAALTIIFVVVSWLKTEGGWRWRWGDDERR
jgi:hypothetical protein